MPTFDIVSEVNMPEVVNAVTQAQKELANRYDFKGSKSSIELKEAEKQIVIVGDDEFKLKSVIEILYGKLAKRGISLKAIEEGKMESAFSGTVRQPLTLINGISKEKAKDIITEIKDSKLKVQPTIQGEKVRVSGAKKDVLQETIALLRTKDFNIALTFENFRD